MSRYLVNLKKGNDYLVPKVFFATNDGNVLATLTTQNLVGHSIIYNANEDSICQINIRRANGANTILKINDVDVLTWTTDTIGYYTINAKSGSKVELYCLGYTTSISADMAKITAFGIKY